jgi:hypothetical protein
MLSSSAAPHRMPTAKNLSTRRTTFLQHTLNFFDIPIPETQVWETLENEQITAAIAVLARLIVKATFPHQKLEEDHD